MSDHVVDPARTVAECETFAAEAAARGDEPMAQKWRELGARNPRQRRRG